MSTLAVCSTVCLWAGYLAVSTYAYFAVSLAVCLCATCLQSNYLVWPSVCLSCSSLPVCLSACGSHCLTACSVRLPVCPSACKWLSIWPDCLPGCLAGCVGLRPHYIEGYGAGWIKPIAPVATAIRLIVLESLFRL